MYEITLTSWKFDHVYIRHYKLHGNSPCKSAALRGPSFLFPISVRYHQNHFEFRVERGVNGKHTFVPPAHSTAWLFVTKKFVVFKVSRNHR